MSGPDLKPCPFCGTGPKFQRQTDYNPETFIRCANGDCRVSVTTFDKTELEVVAAWQARAADQGDGAISDELFAGWFIEFYHSDGSVSIVSADADIGDKFPLYRRAAPAIAQQAPETPTPNWRALYEQALADLSICRSGPHNFCPACGKRTAAGSLHTCTLPEDPAAPAS